MIKFEKGSKPDRKRVLVKTEGWEAMTLKEILAFEDKITEIKKAGYRIEWVELDYLPGECVEALEEMHTRQVKLAREYYRRTKQHSGQH